MLNFHTKITMLKLSYYRQKVIKFKNKDKTKDRLRVISEEETTFLKKDTAFSEKHTDEFSCTGE